MMCDLAQREVLRFLSITILNKNNVNVSYCWTQKVWQILSNNLIKN